MKNTNKVSIKTISIKHFRSITSVNISADKLNIFVGLNDVGKSNILKALNLFFNGETDYNQGFVFEKDFSKLFPEKNKKAKEIGAKNTNFVTPNGLDADNHYSTAYDMALIGAYATKNKQFNEITNTKSYSFTDVSAKRSITDK